MFKSKRQVATATQKVCSGSLVVGSAANIKADVAAVAVERLLGLRARREHLAGAWTLWLRAVEEERQQRRSKLVDALGHQMQVANRRCEGLERALRQHSLLCVLAAWRGELRFGQKWRSWLHSVSRTYKQCTDEALVVMTWRVFAAWHSEVRSRQNIAATPSPMATRQQSSRVWSSMACRSASVGALDKRAQMCAASLQQQSPPSSTKVRRHSGNRSGPKGSLSSGGGSSSAPKNTRAAHTRSSVGGTLRNMPGDLPGEPALLQNRFFELLGSSSPSRPSSARSVDAVREEASQWGSAWAPIDGALVSEAQSDDLCASGKRNLVDGELRSESGELCDYVRSSRDSTPRGNSCGVALRDKDKSLPGGCQRLFYDKKNYTGTARYKLNGVAEVKRKGESGRPSSRSRVRCRSAGGEPERPVGEWSA